MSPLREYPVVIRRPLSWGQMDAFQHVNNVEYFRFFEDARIAYFEAIDLYDATDVGALSGVGPILASTSCKFIRPLTYPDDVRVGARVTGFGEHRFTVEHAVASVDSERVVAAGEAEVVSFHYGEGRKVEVPADWRRAIEQLESEHQ